MEHDIFVAGASAGGVEALTHLVHALPADFAGTLFVVLHLPAESPSLLARILGRAGVLPASHPRDGESIARGHIYVAPPDYHLLLERGYMRVVRGPKENRHRPAIDPLFRSAARSYGTRTVGIVLSGMLDDGTAGLMAIKRRGGLAIVQRPSEALYPSMPQSALNHVHVDYCLPIDEIGPLLVSLTREPGGEQEVGLSADALEKEVWTAEMGTDASDGQEHVGQPSVFSCPECGGVLWEIKDGNFLRFRCRVGHALSAESMLAEQTEAVDKALWNAFKTLEEQVSLTRQLAQRAQAQKNSHLAQRFLMRARKVEEDARQLRQILLNTPAQEQVSELQEQEKPEEAAE